MSMNLKNLLITLCLILGLFWSNFSKAQNEYLISYEKIVSYPTSTFEFLLPTLIDEDFPISIDSVFATLDLQYTVDLYKIQYYAEHPIHGEILASGAVAIPQAFNCDLPLAIYQHGTTFDWDGVPSYLSLEHYLGSMFSTSGYVSLMPDYLGLGDSPFMHPYSHAQSTANAGRDMIRAFKEMAAEIGVVWNKEIFITGYSQGGHGAMALFKDLEENYSDEFTVTACSALSGAYSISGVMQDVMFKEYSSPKYLPYVIVGYQSVYPELLGNSSFKAPFISELSNLNDFEGNTKDFFEILDEYDSLKLIPNIPIEMLKADLVEEFKNDDSHPFKIAMRESDNYDWDAKAPLFIQGCCNDEQVSIENARLAKQTMENRGKTNIDYVDFCDEYPEVGTLRHNDCIPYCLLETKVFFDANSMRSQCDAIVSIDKTENNVGFGLYPNPANGNFVNLTIEKPINENVALGLYNAKGQLVWLKNENELSTNTKINTANLANGFYSITVRSEEHNFNVPFFVNK